MYIYIFIYYFLPLYKCYTYVKMYINIYIYTCDILTSLYLIFIPFYLR